MFSNSLLGLLTWLRRGVVRRLVVVVAMTAGSLALAWHFMPPLDYLPKGNRNLILAVVQVPPGFNLEQIERMLIELEGRYIQMPQIERLFTVARTENPLFGLILKREAADIHSMQQVVDELRKRSTGIPGARAVFVTQSPCSGAPGNCWVAPISRSMSKAPTSTPYGRLRQTLRSSPLFTGDQFRALEL